jgi:hypothetical protein
MATNNQSAYGSNYVDPRTLMSRSPQEAVKLQAQGLAQAKAEAAAQARKQAAAQAQQARQQAAAQAQQARQKARAQQQATAKAALQAKAQPRVISNPYSLAPPRPTPLSKDDGFYGSPEYDAYRKSTEGSDQSADMQYDPISGEYGSSTLNQAQADAYKKYQQNNPNGLPKITLPPPPRNLLGNPQSSLGQMGQMGQSNSPPTTSAAPTTAPANAPMKKGGKVKSSSYKSGGSVSASRRGDGIAQRGKTKGRFV